MLVRALRAMAPPGPVLWWRDFPYTTRADTPRRPFEDALAGFPEVALPTDPDAKHAACAAYATQLDYQFGGAEGLARALAATGGQEVARLQGSMP